VCWPRGGWEGERSYGKWKTRRGENIGLFHDRGMRKNHLHCGIYNPRSCVYKRHNLKEDCAGIFKNALTEGAQSGHKFYPKNPAKETDWRMKCRRT